MVTHHGSGHSVGVAKSAAKLATKAAAAAAVSTRRAVESVVRAVDTSSSLDVSIAGPMVRKYRAIPQMVAKLQPPDVGLILKAATVSRDINTLFPHYGIFYGEFCLGYVENSANKRTPMAAMGAGEQGEDAEEEGDDVGGDEEELGNVDAGAAATGRRHKAVKSAGRERKSALKKKAAYTEGKRVLVDGPSTEEGATLPSAGRKRRRGAVPLPDIDDATAQSAENAGVLSQPTTNPEAGPAAIKRKRTTPAAGPDAPRGE